MTTDYELKIRERRTFQRYEYSANIACNIKNSDESFNARITDYSKGGIGFTSKKSIKDGADVLKGLIMSAKSAPITSLKTMAGFSDSETSINDLAFTDNRHLQSKFLDRYTAYQSINSLAKNHNSNCRQKKIRDPG